MVRDGYQRLSLTLILTFDAIGGFRNLSTQILVWKLNNSYEGEFKVE